MLDKFKAKKRNIIDRLSVPDDDYSDASPKGHVDEGISKLVTEINSLPNFVTTSSCSGRVAIFVEGAAGSSGSTNVSSEEDGQITSPSRNEKASRSGGKGGGKWLFHSHIPLSVGSAMLAQPGAVYSSIGFPTGNQIAVPSPSDEPQYIHMKFEPMILHILTASTEAAQAALHAAVTAGFRESGISSILDNKGRPNTPMVAVRSTGMALDSIIGFRSASTNFEITPMVSEDYVATLIRIANSRFQINEERKARFREAFLEQARLMDTDSPKPIRKGQKEIAKLDKNKDRRERQESLGGSADDQNHTRMEDDSDDDYGFSILGEVGPDVDEQSRPEINLK